jgi:hypothetical protein
VVTRLPDLSDPHEWISFEDPDEERTWVFDLTFLTSNWSCIYGRGCQGVLTGPAPELEQGCCSYGAHFVDDADRERVIRHSERLDSGQWQHRAEAARRGGPTKVDKSSDAVTRLVDDACIFLNRPGFPGGAGCALHRAALEAGESFIEWKPEVCWQLPLRRHDDTDQHGYVTSTVREWKRRDWGEGGDDFHWWCTESGEAFVGEQPVYLTLRDELVELCGPAPYELLVRHIESRIAAATDPADPGPRMAEVFLPHPAVRKG